MGKLKCLKDEQVEGDQSNLHISLTESQADSLDQLKKQLVAVNTSGLRARHMGESGNTTLLNNRSTIDISSYTSDSLFNSNFILTPMCSDAVSPSGQWLVKSPLLHTNLRVGCYFNLIASPSMNIAFNCINKENNFQNSHSRRILPTAFQRNHPASQYRQQPRLCPNSSHASLT